MIRKNNKELYWLEFELLAPFPRLKHAVLLRHGGFSKGHFSSLNLGYGRGDELEKVQKNHSLIKRAFNIKHLAEAKQIHSDNVLVVDNKQPLAPGDALITNSPYTTLKITHADCQAAIFYDPINHILANVHCGWRGLVSNIYRKVIQKLKKRYASKPEDLHVAISPSLGPDHAEFIHYKSEFPEDFWQFKDNGCHFNLWELAKWQLEMAKVLPSHIQVASLCTFAHSEDCFSYRRSKGVTGVHGTIATLI